MGRPGLTNHRKFHRLTRKLGSAMLARGAVELMWESCYECGDDYLGTADDLEHLVGWAGEPGVLTRALLEAGAPEGFGFIEPVSTNGDGPASYCVHDLWHHAPDYVRKRYKREQARQARVKPGRRNRRTADSDHRTAPNGGQCPPSLDSQTGVVLTPSPSPSPSPSPTPDDRSFAFDTSDSAQTVPTSVEKKPRSGRVNGTDLRQRFDAFWASYPRKIGKDAAWRAWQQRRPDTDLTAAILAAVAWQVRQDNWLREGGRFIPNPATWLKAGRWQDEPSQTPRVNQRTLAIARAGEQFLSEGKS